MRTTKNVLAVLFTIVAVTAIGFIVWNLILDEPSKINNEWQTRLIVMIIPAVVGTSCGAIAYGLFRSQLWSFYLYTMLLICWTAFCLYLLGGTSLNSLMGNLGSNIVGVVILLGIPLFVEIVMLRVKETVLAK